MKKYCKIKEYRASIQAGEGRLLEGLQKNNARVSNLRKQARKDVSMKQRNHTEAQMAQEDEDGSQGIPDPR
jgi:hypothetical protein